MCVKLNSVRPPSSVPNPTSPGTLVAHLLFPLDLNFQVGLRLTNLLEPVQEIGGPYGEWGWCFVPLDLQKIG